MTFTIRTACADDVPAMHRLRCRVRENRLADPERVSEDSYLAYVEAGSIWVAEAECKVAGFAAINAPAGSVWALFVDPDSEGLGIGSGLHLRMLSWAGEQGLRRLTLSTDEGTRAARFYSRAGWTEAGTTPGASYSWRWRCRVRCRFRQLSLVFNCIAMHGLESLVLAGWGEAMGEYRLYCLDGAGRIELAEWIDAPGDAEALAEAKRVNVHAGKCEIWSRDRLVATFNGRDLPE